MRILIISALAFILTGCLEEPDFETGEGCWRYGVLEENNTGRMSTLDIEDIPVIKVDYETLGKECDFETGELAWSNRSIKAPACFKADDEGGKIYLLKLYSGKVDLIHEKCHITLGEKHNACYGKGYAQWGSDVESACGWDAE